MAFTVQARLPTLPQAPQSWPFLGRPTLWICGKVYGLLNLKLHPLIYTATVAELVPVEQLLNLFQPMAFPFLFHVTQPSIGECKRILLFLDHF